MTEYILIPVKVLKDRIKLGKRELAACREYGFYQAASASRTRMSTYKMLLEDTTLKHIKL